MKKRRSDCPLAGALDIIGDRWTLLIIRDMAAFKKTYFRDFMASDEGIATNILTTRLNRLVEQGIIKRVPDLEDGSRIKYLLTPKGRELVPVIRAVGAWGHKYIKGTKNLPGGG